MKKQDAKSETAMRIARTEAYAEKVRKLFAQTVNAVLALNRRMPELEEGVMYSFDGQGMKVQKQVEGLLRRLHSVATLAIRNGIEQEWEQANAECDRLVQSCFGKEVLSSPEFSAWVQRNGKARDAFMARSEGGLNLSDRVWQSVRQLRDEMEVAMTVAIGEGDSAASMSRKVREYLNDPDLMFRRFRYKDAETGEWKRKWKKRVKDEETGKYRWIDYDRDSYRTGPGVYKSSAKNAMRVARTETNIAYRRADHERWQQMDFVLGQRVQLSRSHPEKDICDKLQGDYPKDFVFDGWHPQCFCFVTPILTDEDEMAKVTEAFLRGEKYTPKGQPVTDVPQNFKDWVAGHAGQIAAARKRGTEPYFIKNNAGVVDGILKSDENKPALSPFERNLQDVSDAIGVNAGRPMTFEEANESRGNPHYAEDQTYRVNCQSCVVANELRRRGLDVEAYGNIQKKGFNTYALSMKTEAAWVDDNGNIPVPTVIRREIKKTNATINKNGYVRVTKSLERDDELKKKIADAMSEVGRYHISWMWKKKKSGHIITAERLSDGTLRFYDPQSGKTGFHWSMSEIDAHRIGFKILRVDTLKTNVDVISGVVKRSGSTAGTPMMTEIQKAFWKSTYVGKWATDGSKLTEFKKSIRQSEHFPISKERNVVNLHSGRLAYSGKNRKMFINHCRSEAELDAAEYIWSNPEMLEYVGSTALGYVKDMDNEKDRKNVAKKKKRGVQIYNEYKFKFNGNTWHVKLEETNMGNELFYSIIKK